MDNEAGIATGWLDSPLSAVGIEQARARGERHRAHVNAVHSSDLGRAIETVTLAFAGVDTPTYMDARLRECNYGSLNGGPSAEVHAVRLEHLDKPYPGGESYRDVVARVASFLSDLASQADGERILVIAHSATRFALEHLLTGVPLETVVRESGEWRPGWEYHLKVAT